MTPVMAKGMSSPLPISRTWLAFCGQVMGQKEDQGDLGQLRDLKREYPEVEPADSAAGPDPQMGDPDRDEENSRNRDARPGQFPELIVGYPRHQDHDQQAQDKEKDLLLEKELTVAEPLHGEDGAGTVYHHRPDGHQEQCDQQEDQIRFLFSGCAFRLHSVLTSS